MRLPTDKEIESAVFFTSGKLDRPSILYEKSAIREVIALLYRNGCFYDWRRGNPEENGHYRVMFEDSTLGSAYFGGAWSTAKPVAKWRTHEG